METKNLQVENVFPAADFAWQLTGKAPKKASFKQRSQERHSGE